MKKEVDERTPETLSGDRTISYGGFAARQNYEKGKRVWQSALWVALFLVLFLLSAVGLMALVRGDVFSNGGGQEGQGGVGIITVPTVNNRYDSVESAVAAAEGALITVELRTGDGSLRYGSGFILSQDGYAVCHSSLFEDVVITNLSAYISDGANSDARLVQRMPDLGLAVIQLEDSYFYNTISMGSSNYVRRGQALYGVASVQRGMFDGLVLAGNAVSNGDNISVTFRGEARNVPVLYTSVPYDETLEGALLMTADGAAAGFLTGTIPGKGGGMAAVPAITLVGLVNELLSDRAN